MNKELRKQRKKQHNYEPFDTTNKRSVFLETSFCRTPNARYNLDLHSHAVQRRRENMQNRKRAADESFKGTRNEKGVFAQRRCALWLTCESMNLFQNRRNLDILKKWVMFHPPGSTCEMKLSKFPPSETSHIYYFLVKEL